MNCNDNGDRDGCQLAGGYWLPSTCAAPTLQPKQKRLRRMIASQQAEAQPHSKRDQPLQHPGILMPEKLAIKPHHALVLVPLHEYRATLTADNVHCVLIRLAPKMVGHTPCRMDFGRADERSVIRRMSDSHTADNAATQGDFLRGALFRPTVGVVSGINWIGTVHWSIFIDATFANAEKSVRWFFTRLCTMCQLMVS